MHTGPHRVQRRQQTLSTPICVRPNDMSSRKSDRRALCVLVHASIEAVLNHVRGAWLMKMQHLTHRIGDGTLRQATFTAKALKSDELIDTREKALGTDSFKHVCGFAAASPGYGQTPQTLRVFQRRKRFETRPSLGTNSWSSISAAFSPYMMLHLSSG